MHFFCSSACWPFPRRRTDTLVTWTTTLLRPVQDEFTFKTWTSFLLLRLNTASSYFYITAAQLTHSWDETQTMRGFFWLLFYSTTWIFSKTTLSTAMATLYYLPLKMEPSPSSRSLYNFPTHSCIWPWIYAIPRYSSPFELFGTIFS